MDLKNSQEKFNDQSSSLKKKDPLKEILELLEKYEEGCSPRSSRVQDSGE